MLRADIPDNLRNLLESFISIYFHFLKLFLDQVKVLINQLERQNLEDEEAGTSDSINRMKTNIITVSPIIIVI